MANGQWLKAKKSIIFAKKYLNIMEENRYEYNPEEGYDYEKEENEAVKKSLRGYRVVIILLAIILAGLYSYLFSSIVLRYFFANIILCF